MARKFTVMGFTEAELGFILAAFFAAVAVAYQAERATAESEAHTSEAALAVAIAERDRARAQRDSIDALYSSLRDSIAKKSNLTPSCNEKGESSEAIAEISVLAVDRYLMEGDTVSFGEVKVRLANHIARQQQLGCRYFVRVVPVAGVDAPLYASAARRLRALFYVREQ